MSHDALHLAVEKQVEALGFELVRLERAGSQTRPVLRLYVDRPDSRPGEPGVSLEDCTRLSRALEPELDARPDLSDRYVLEVSSPGVERPLVRPRDYERFAGEEIVVRGRSPLAGRERRLEGVLLGRVAEAGDRIRLRLADGEEVEIPLDDVSDANLIYRWKGGKPDT